MALPVCWSCNYIFKWREVLFIIDGRKKCPNCGERQYITTQSNRESGLYGVVLPVIPFVLNVFGLSWILTGSIAFLAMMIYLSVIPFKLQFTNYREPLF
ncbi:cxxc_20_cxxc protein [Lentibacillus persicus]|uniref:Cxxc_20_cxxc protein n=1 Tax=Lentibacillus persicus TaxID=640948 RepID=A0A1I1X875_9BACI|nr:TIGR04104 family putative zinc finger protein [Lentibacillus persicus]SFE03589.1 cxxc_20_cxxc protein [Lentibacillus persicus]